jgi:hypothetical protein
MPPEREQCEKGGCQIESKNQYPATSAVQPSARVVFTRLEPTGINRGGTVRAYPLYMSMLTTGEMRHSIGVLIAQPVAEIHD